jgi:2-iminobutanoate/2-iminopropanoate deaminase
MRPTLRLLPLLLLPAACAPALQQAGRQVVETAAAPAAIGPYSQAIRAGNTLYVAGQIPLDPATGALVPGDIRDQARQTIRNVEAVLHAAGFSLADVVQVQVYLADLDDFAAFNEVYATFFPRSPPARAVVQVARIPRDALVEIMATAAR